MESKMKQKQTFFYCIFIFFRIFFESMKKWSFFSPPFFHILVLQKKMKEGKKKKKRFCSHKKNNGPKKVKTNLNRKYDKKKKMLVGTQSIRINYWRQGFHKYSRRPLVRGRTSLANDI